MPWAEREADECIAVGKYVRVGVVGAVTVLFVLDLPIRRFSREDFIGVRVEIAALESMELLSQTDVARAGLFPEATFHRDCIAFRKGGEAAIRPRAVRSNRGARKLLPEVLVEIERLCAPGLPQAAIGQRQGMSSRSVLEALKALKATAATPAALPLPSSEPVDAVVAEAPCDSEEVAEARPRRWRSTPTARPRTPTSARSASRSSGRSSGSSRASGRSRSSRRCFRRSPRRASGAFCSRSHCSP